MTHIVFVDSCGDDLTANPSRDYITQLLMRGDDYWLDPMGNGFATFEYIVDGMVAESLGITKKSTDGFFLCITRMGEGDSYYAINETRNVTDWVTLDYSGEPYPTPAVLFHPSERTVDVLVEYCDVKMRSQSILPPSLTWIPGSKLRIDRDNLTYSEIAMDARYRNYT